MQFRKGHHNATKYHAKKTSLKDLVSFDLIDASKALEVYSVYASLQNAFKEYLKSRKMAFYFEHIEVVGNKIVAVPKNYGRATHKYLYNEDFDTVIILNSGSKTGIRGVLCEVLKVNGSQSLNGCKIQYGKIKKQFAFDFLSSNSMIECHLGAFLVNTGFLKNWALGWLGEQKAVNVNIDRFLNQNADDSLVCYTRAGVEFFAVPVGAKNDSSKWMPFGIDKVRHLRKIDVMHEVLQDAESFNKMIDKKKASIGNRKDNKSAIASQFFNSSRTADHCPLVYMQEDKRDYSDGFCEMSPYLFCVPSKKEFRGVQIEAIAILKRDLQFN